MNGVNIVLDSESGQNADKSFCSERPRNYCSEGLLTNTR